MTSTNILVVKTMEMWCTKHFDLSDHHYMYVAEQLFPD